jgi:hypothetical protein
LLSGEKRLFRHAASPRKSFRGLVQKKEEKEEKREKQK